MYLPSSSLILLSTLNSTYAVCYPYLHPITLAFRYDLVRPISSYVAPQA